MIGAYNLLFNNPSSEKDSSDRDNDQKFLRKKLGTLEEESYDPLPRFAEKESLIGCDDEEDWEDLPDYGPSSHFLY